MAKARDGRGFWTRVVRGGGGWAGFLRAVLTPFSWVYGAAVGVRNWTFDAGLRRVCRLPAPVLCVGNITAGGTGKTPMVEWLAGRLAEMGRRPAVLSRGYRAEGPGRVNDEAMALEANCPGLIQAPDPDRARGGRRALEELGADTLVMDDGFQHRRLARDLNVALVDALDPWGGGRLLPAGALREPRGSLRRADVVVLTRCNLAPAEAVERLAQDVARLAPGCLVARAGYEAESLIPAEGGEALPAAWLRGRPVFGFCGVGAPEGFWAMLERLGPSRLAGVALEDHAAYPPARLAALAAEARASGAEVVVMTQKDAVKIGTAWPGPPRALALRARMTILDGEAALVERIGRALRRGAA